MQWAPLSEQAIKALGPFGGLLARDVGIAGSHVRDGRNFDRERLIQSLVLNAAGDGLAISSKGKTAAELMVFARYVMFSEVYWHHAVRSATCMLARSFYEVHERLDLRQLFAHIAEACSRVWSRALTASANAHRPALPAIHSSPALAPPYRVP